MLGRVTYVIRHSLVHICLKLHLQDTLLQSLEKKEIVMNCHECYEIASHFTNRPHGLHMCVFLAFRFGLQQVGLKKFEYSLLISVIPLKTPNS